MPVTLQNQILINAPSRQLFDYVTQPWRWHEWHPNSRSANAEVEVLQVGDHFDEVIEVQPLAPLPPKLQRQTHYVVEVSEPHRHWQVKGDTGDGWLVIRYDLFPEGEQTRFERTLTFDVRWPTRLLLPALERQMRRTSAVALGNLKERLETR